MATGHGDLDCFRNLNSRLKPPQWLQGMAQRNIVIKSFSDVPMADVEMIFPEKKVFIKPFVLIQLVVTVVLAIITVVTTLLQVNRLYLRSACT